MMVELIEGHARITARGTTQILRPGEMLTVPLGGANGLTAVGTPSTPIRSATETSLALALGSVAQLSDPDAPASITIDGCVTAVNGNSVEIVGYRLDSSQNSALKGAKVGDCFEITGRLALDRQNRVTWTLGTVTAVAADTVPDSGATDNTKPIKPRARVTITPLALPTVSLPALPTLPPNIPTLPPLP
jgi:hypothetical protein